MALIIGSLTKKIFGRFRSQSGEKFQYENGLVLSGGAARGFAHPGVIKALHENGVIPDCVSGTSAGAIVGVFYADGFEPEEIIELFKKKKVFNFVNIALGRKGLLSISGLEKTLKNNLRAKTFDQLQKPFYVASTNFNSGEIEYFNEGDLVEKVVASSSIPVLFKPVEIGGDWYVDGGVLDNLPHTPLKGKCRNLIGVHVNYTGPEKEINNLMEIAERAFHLSIGARIKEISGELDVFIEPEELKHYSVTDVGEGDKMFRIGYEEALRILKEAGLEGVPAETAG